MKIAFEGPQSGLEVVRELLFPWDVSFTDSSQAETTLAYETLPELEKFVVIPSADFVRKSKKGRSAIEVRPGGHINVDVNQRTQLTITPFCSYRYSRLMKTEHRDNGLFEVDDADGVYLTTDVIGEFNSILHGVLNPKISRTYKVITSMPVPYSIAPKRFKNLFMKQKKSEISNRSFCDCLALDALRFILARAIEKSSGKKLLRRKWAGKRYAFVMTHDVDTQNGLYNSKNLKKIEDKYDIPSAWYIPSQRYKLDTETVRSLACHGEIGCHDTKHNGKLGFLKQVKLASRVTKAKKALEDLVGSPVKGWRTPLLQHKASILKAVKDSGFNYDSSIPTWEYRHPFTMKPHGIQTAFPLSINGLLEIPVTIPQDHQMFAVSGFGCRESLERWLHMANIVKNLGGLCLFLVHPDYQLADIKTGIYEELLNYFASDRESWIALPSSLRPPEGNK